MPTQNELAELCSRENIDEREFYPQCITKLITQNGFIWASETRGDEAAYFNFSGNYMKPGWEAKSRRYWMRAIPVRSIK